MNFITESYSYAANGGRIVLRACIDKPLYCDHAAYKYFDLYSSSISTYVADSLLQKATDAYLEANCVNVRFWPFVYYLKCSATYSDELYDSFVIAAMLSQTGKTLAHGIDSVVFSSDRILPPEILFRSQKKQKIALDFDGFPSVAEFSDEKVLLRRVGKKSIIK